jgi:hypothetical protein
VKKRNQILNHLKPQKEKLQRERLTSRDVWHGRSSQTNTVVDRAYWDPIHLQNPSFWGFLGWALPTNYPLLTGLVTTLYSLLLQHEFCRTLYTRPWNYARLPSGNTSSQLALALTLVHAYIEELPIYRLSNRSTTIPQPFSDIWLTSTFSTSFPDSTKRPSYLLRLRTVGTIWNLGTYSIWHMCS